MKKLVFLILLLLPSLCFADRIQQLINSQTSFVYRGDHDWDRTKPEFDAAAVGSYTDWDLSAIVPAGAKTVVLFVSGKDTTVGVSLSLRKNGDTYPTGVWYNIIDSVIVTGVYIVPLDSSGIIEYKYSANMGVLNVKVIGWFF